MSSQSLRIIQQIIAKLRRIPLYLRHGPFMLYWCFYDYILSLWVYVKDIDSVGMYVKILSPSEKALLFKEVAGCGYSGFTLIKLYFEEQYMNVEAVIDVLNHETLHQTLRKCIGEKTSSEFDNVQKSFVLRIYWWHPKERRLIRF